MKAARAAAVVTWVYAAGFGVPTAVVNVALLPVEAIFWLGFAVPIPWLVGAARVVLIAIAWRSLSDGQHSGAPSEKRARTPLAGA
jgi:hypothetical protein